jgi:hypothetical protein
MKSTQLPLFVILLGTIATSAQDSKPVTFESFAAVKVSVLRITSQHGYSGFDQKILSRAGDLTSIAIVKNIPESELASTATMKEVLLILHIAFACSSRCIADFDNRHPQVIMLLLEHLRNRTSGSTQSEVDETTDFIREQTRDVK